MKQVTKHTVTVSMLGVAVLLSGCEIGRKTTTQSGYRGTGADQIVDAGNLKAATAIPANAYETPADTGQRASEVYQNVRVLGGVSADRFNHLMANMSNWVVPQKGLPESEQGCNYCHNPANMASDEKYTKVVARRMIQMTQNINANWTDHVQQTGVTCWTCHRGNAVPTYRWATAKADPGTIRGNKHGQNTPGVAAIGFASLPYDPFTQYQAGPKAEAIRVGGGVYPKMAPGASIQQTEKTYALMMHMSKGLGVNCTFCHNTQNFQSWTNSTSQRATAWYGLRMVAANNHEYMGSLANVFPAFSPVVADNKARKGPMGDVYKINCQTCHQGVNKPMNGVSMRAQNPVLWPAGLATAAAAVVAPKADPNATAATCDAAFATALAGKTIEFDTGAATIRPTSAALLDSLVQTAGRCSNFKMSIEGHTDAVGNAASNLKLSQSRAAAVESYLVKSGVSNAQLSAAGFGSTKPVDTSGTPAGNQRNRRIEINVAGA
jgi:photosynthetic reaction center cytochrome c subunit